MAADDHPEVTMRQRNPSTCRLQLRVAAGVDTASLLAQIRIDPGREYNRRLALDYLVTEVGVHRE
jgi:hypothetical protein